MDDRLKRMKCASEQYVEGAINELEFTNLLTCMCADLNDRAKSHEPGNPNEPYYGCRDKMPETETLALALARLGQDPAS